MCVCGSSVCVFKFPMWLQCATEVEHHCWKLRALKIFHQDCRRHPVLWFSGLRIWAPGSHLRRRFWLRAQSGHRGVSSSPGDVTVQPSLRTTAPSLPLLSPSPCHCQMNFQWRFQSCHSPHSHICNYSLFPIKFNTNFSSHKDWMASNQSPYPLNHLQHPSNWATSYWPATHIL